MPSEDAFRSLICRVRQGDEEAAAELVRLYEPTIRRVARIRLGDAHLRRVLDSIDISQSVFTSFFTRTALGLYELERPEQMLKLLWAMCRKKVVNHARAEGAARRDYRRQADGAELDTVPAATASPSRYLGARELLEELRRRLPEPERYLAEQRAQDRAWDDIAREQGASPDALRKKLSRAVSRVARDLGLEEFRHG
jgi:RNA polymerase sigma-70 factor (ECF subfamily)